MGAVSDYAADTSRTDDGAAGGGDGCGARGIDVKDRGRVPAELRVKFKAATGQQRLGRARRRRYRPLRTCRIEYVIVRIGRSRTQLSAQFVTSVLSRAFIIKTQAPGW
jgi:hypothetical protein